MASTNENFCFKFKVPLIRALNQQDTSDLDFLKLLLKCAQKQSADFLDEYLKQNHSTTAQKTLLLPTSF